MKAAGVIKLTARFLIFILSEYANSFFLLLHLGHRSSPYLSFILLQFSSYHYLDFHSGPPHFLRLSGRAHVPQHIRSEFQSKPECSYSSAAIHFSEFSFKYRMLNCLFAFTELFNHNILSWADWKEPPGNQTFYSAAVTDHIPNTLLDNFVVDTIKKEFGRLQCIFLPSPQILQDLRGNNS